MTEIEKGSRGEAPSEAEVGDQQFAPSQQEVTEKEQLSEIDTLRKRLEEEEAKAAEYLHHLQRVQADFINYKRRAEQERVEQQRYSSAALIRKLLTALDDFERGFVALPGPLLSLSWVEGIQLIYQKLWAILEQEGLKPIEVLGKDFDPFLHEALMQQETEPEKVGKVIAEVQRGYMFHDRVIRPALVVVGKAKESREEQPPKEPQTVPGGEGQQ